MLSCALSESSERNRNHIVHFWCVSSITTTVGKKLLHYCLQQDFRIAGRNNKCGYVCSLSQMTFHFLSHCKGLFSWCAPVSGILLHSDLGQHRCVANPPDFFCKYFTSSINASSLLKALWKGEGAGEWSSAKKQSVLLLSLPKY